MKQTTKVNLAQSQNTGSGGTSSRGGSSSRGRGGRGGRGQSLSTRGGGSGTTGGTSGATGTGGPSLSSSSSNQNNPRCNACNYHHTPGLCPHANLECHVCGEKGHIHRNCPRKGQFGGQQGQNSSSSNLMIGMVQTIVAAAGTEEFPVIEEAPASDIFLRIIYTTVPKLLAFMSTTVWILDSGATRHVSGDRTRFPNLTDYEDSCRTASGEQLAIKGKGNIDLSVGDTVLRLSDALYVPGLTVNLISTAKLWRNGIGVYFPPGQPAELSFNGKIFAYADNVRDQFILRQSREQSVFKISKPAMDLKIWHSRLVHLSYRNVVANAKKVVGMEGVKGPIPTELCESCMAGHQELEISRMPMPKATEFLGRLHVDIEGPLPVTFSGFRYFLSIKDDAWGMFFVLPMKTKGEIYDKLVDFRTWIENLADQKIKCIRSGGELRSNAFDTWFKATGIQWEPSAPYTPQQNGKVERGMYTLMSAVRSVLKEFQLPKGLWDEIVQAVAYVKNRTISRSANGITPYEGVNKSVPSVAHLRALGCRCYVHVPDTTMRQTMHDRGWKGIMVGYGGVNQWRVYNPKTRRIHVSASVRFDEGFSYYDTSHEVEDEDDDGAELGDVWNEADDEEFGKVMDGKQVVGRDATLAHSTPQSQEGSVVADSEEEGDNNSLPESAMDNDHPLPNQPMPPPAIPSEIPFPLTDISGANTSLPPETFHDPEEEEDLPESPNKLQGDNTTDQPGSSRQSRTKSGILKRVDYKNLRRPGEAMLVSHNVFHAKRIPQSHTHMVRVLSALANGDNLGLSHYSEPQNYREARNSQNWPAWKAAMDLEVQSLLHNETWVLVPRPESRFVISGRWVFRIKFGVDGRIIKYKTRWVVHGYKQQEGVDYNKTWAGVVKPSSFRSLFEIAAKRSLYMEQMDVVTAFLYGFLDEDIFVNQPEGYVIDAALVCHLRKALYGLKQAPRVWYALLSEFLQGLGFTKTDADQCFCLS